MEKAIAERLTCTSHPRTKDEDEKDSEMTLNRYPRPYGRGFLANSAKLGFA